MRTATLKRRQSPAAPFTPVSPIQRIEGAAIAAVTAIVFVVAGFSWWWLPALFLVFDLSFIGYAISNRVGALSYNLAHNYAAPAVLFAAYTVSLTVGNPVPSLAVIAACWFFHVGADRALGFGPRPSK